MRLEDSHSDTDAFPFLSLSLVTAYARLQADCSALKELLPGYRAAMLNAGPRAALNRLIGDKFRLPAAAPDPDAAAAGRDDAATTPATASALASAATAAAAPESTAAAAAAATWVAAAADAGVSRRLDDSMAALRYLSRRVFNLEQLASDRRSDTVTSGIRVTAESNLVPSKSNPRDDSYFYEYAITITNETRDEPVQLAGGRTLILTRFGFRVKALRVRAFWV